jgi:integrative and conjugative element protein (TIGR02256 family)
LGNGVMEGLLLEARRCAPLETGGVLLGWRDATDVCVTNIIGPGPRATHDRTSFMPDADWQAEQVALLYSQSGRRLAYLGDWHTHPGAAPIPSARDRKTLRVISRHRPARCPNPIMVILGQVHEGERWTTAGHSVVRECFPPTIRVVESTVSVDASLRGWS